MLGRALYFTVFDLVCLYSWLLSHCNFAQVEAAVQRERGGQEAEATESSPRGERVLPSTVPSSFDLTAARTYTDGRSWLLQNNDIVLSAPAEAFYQMFVSSL